MTIITKGQSNTNPGNFLKSNGKTQILYNIIQKEIINEFEKRIVWEYDYVEIEGEVTKLKIINALNQVDIENDTTSIVANNIYTEYNNAKLTLSLSEISHITYAQLDNYIDNNITTLVQAKIYLKKLSAIVLALVKKYND